MMQRPKCSRQVFIFLSLGGILLGIGYFLPTRLGHLTQQAASRAQNEQDPEGANPLAEPNPPESAISAQQSAEISSSSLGGQQGGAAELDSRSTDVDSTATPMIPDQFNQQVHRLAAQGPAAVPVILALLKQNADPNSDQGTERRTALLEALGEAVAASRQVLQTTSDPLEIAQLTRILEEAAPGQYRQDAFEAVRGSLEAVAEGRLPNVDVGPLFETLQSFGDTNVVSELASLAPNWNYYAPLALAGLPSGQGIPTLIELAMDPSPAETTSRQFALQMLAQVSAQYPQASDALVELSQQGQVPDSAWPAIADVLAGHQFQFKSSADVSSSVGVPGLRTYRQPIGNQSFISVPVPADGSAGDLTQRLALIDQLLASTPNPAAAQVLQDARTKVVAITGQVGR